MCVAIQRFSLSHPTRLAYGYPASHLMVSSCALRVNAVSTDDARVKVHLDIIPGLSGGAQLLLTTVAYEKGVQTKEAHLPFGKCAPVGSEG